MPCGLQGALNGGRRGQAVSIAAEIELLEKDQRDSPEIGIYPFLPNYQNQGD
jgi:hypothetical protein